MMRNKKGEKEYMAETTTPMKHISQMTTSDDQDWRPPRRSESGHTGEF